jgi:hypothetical protein
LPKSKFAGVSRSLHHASILEMNVEGDRRKTALKRRKAKRVDQYSRPIFTAGPKIAGIRCDYCP